MKLQNFKEQETSRINTRLLKKNRVSLTLDSQVPSTRGWKTGRLGRRLLRAVWVYVRIHEFPRGSGVGLYTQPALGTVTLPGLFPR